MNSYMLTTLFSFFLVLNNASAQYVEIGKSYEDSANVYQGDWKENKYVNNLLLSKVSNNCLKYETTDEEEYFETGIRTKVYLDTTCAELNTIRKLKIDICNASDGISYCYESNQNLSIFRYFKQLDTFNINFSFERETTAGNEINNILRSIKIPSTVKVIQHTSELMPKLTYLETSYLFGLSNLKYVSYKDLLARYSTRVFGEPFRVDSFPEGITKLEIVNANFKNIPALPSTIDTLIINDNKTIEFVTDLETSQNYSIRTIPNLPSGLRYLDVSNNIIDSLPLLPVSLEYLDISENDLSTLPDIPSGIKYLAIGNPNPKYVPKDYDSEMIYSFDTVKNIFSNVNNLILPPQLISFKLSNIDAVGLPNLPSSLQYLDASTNVITHLPTLPLVLKEFNIGTNKLVDIPTLPTGLISLKAGRNLFKDVPELPEYLTELWLDNSDSITSLPTLPRKLSVLNLSNCKRLTCLPVFPKTLKIYTAPTSVGCIPNYTDFIKTGTICNSSRICNVDDFARLGGRAFIDVNNNGVFNTGIDKPVKNVIIKNERTDYSFYSVTNVDGFYQILADTATINDILFPENFVQYTTLSPLKYVVNPTSASYLGDTFNFKLTPIPNVKDLEISVTDGGNVARPGFTHDVYLQYSNLGTTPAQGTVKFNYPENWEIIESLPAYSQQSGDTLYWNNMNMGAFSEMNTIKISLRVPVETPLGLPYSYTGIITPLEGDANTENNFSILNSETVGSFDPNDKLVHPEVLLPGYSDSTELTYTIRFQNTGTYYAENVIILDTLTSDIDPASIKVISSSHDYKFNILGNGILEFWFEDIMLPDSNENEIASHGHIVFTARPKSGIAEGQKIINNAGIYFDYNKPIITDYATTFVRVATSVQLNEEVNALVYPNPAQHTVNVRLNNKKIDATISLYNIQGRKISERKLDTGLASFDVQNLPQGMYLIVIQNQDVYKSVKFLITH